MQNKFESGLYLLSKGEYLRAAKLFDKILIQNPNLNRVRLELARSLFLGEQFIRSKKEFKKVLSLSPPKKVVVNIKTFIEAIDKTLKQSSYLETEINLSSLQKTRLKKDYVNLNFLGQSIPFKINNPEKKGEGLRVSGKLAFPFLEKFDGSFWQESEVELYKYKKEKFNFTKFDLWIPFKIRTQHRRYELGPIYGFENLAMQDYQYNKGLKFRMSNFKQKLYNQTEIKYKSINYSPSTLLEKAEELHFNQFFFPKASKYISNYGFNFTNHKSKNKYDSYLSSSLKLKSKKTGNEEINFISDLEYKLINYDDINPIFTNKREDNILTYKIQLNSSLLKFQQLTIKPQLKIIESQSSINIHCYRDISLNFIITR